MDLDGGHGAERVHIRCNTANLHIYCVVHLGLAEGQDGGHIVHLNCPHHRLHVQNLTAEALHQHREEVWIGEVKSASQIHGDTLLRGLKVHRDRVHAIEHDEHGARKEEEGPQTGR